MVHQVVATHKCALALVIFRPAAVGTPVPQIFLAVVLLGIFKAFLFKFRAIRDMVTFKAARRAITLQAVGIRNGLFLFIHRIGQED